MKRFAHKVLVVVSAILLVAALAQWVTSYAAPRWVTLRHEDVAYNVLSTGGRLLLQRAHLQYPPRARKWGHACGACFGTYGPESSSSPSFPFEQLGLVDTVIVVPEEVEPTMGPNVAAASAHATGRQVTIPSWVAVAVFAALPLRRVIAHFHERQERRRRGFAVLPQERPAGSA